MSQTSDILGFSHNYNHLKDLQVKGPIKRIYPVSSSCVEENVLLDATVTQKTFGQPVGSTAVCRTEPHQFQPCSNPRLQFTRFCQWKKSMAVYMRHNFSCGSWATFWKKKKTTLKLWRVFPKPQWNNSCWQIPELQGFIVSSGTRYEMWCVISNCK